MIGKISKLMIQNEEMKENGMMRAIKNRIVRLRLASSSRSAWFLTKNYR